MSEVMNYDPNMVMSGRRAKQVVRLVFGDWRYRYETHIEVGGNCRGMSVIKFAVEQLFEKLSAPNDWNWAEIVMTDANGDTLTDDQIENEDMLLDKLILAEIVSIEPNGSFYDDESEAPE